MNNLIISLLEDKGFTIGFFAGLLKILQDVRLKAFIWYVALTDIVASSIIGYSVYSWASESSSLKEWQVITLTVMLSLNAFFVIKLVTSPKVINMLIKTWFKVDVKDAKD